MKITNKMNLPMPFVRMAESDYKYTEKRYSITTLLKPTREILLCRRHDHEVEQDCSEMIWALFGQAVHHILQQASDGKTEFAEERLEYTLENGYTISGIIDLYDMAKEEVVDYKTASTWKVVFNDFKDWEKQGLGYAWLLQKNGLPCKTVKFYGILKDHSKSEAKRKADYPKLPVVEVPFRFDSIEEIDKYLREKVDELIKCESIPDDELPLCSEEDRWRSPNKYAVMKKGRKSALRLLDTQEEAEEWQKVNGGDSIEVRPGLDKKCIDYCSCKNYCKYYLENVKEEETE